MSNEYERYESEPSVMVLENAIGSIEAKTEHQKEVIPEIEHSLVVGKFYVETSERMVCGCIDGRCGGDISPCSAGGTIGLMVADDLINKRFGAPEGTTDMALKNTISYLAENGMKLGGHTADSHVDEASSGCGASDKLEAIYKFIAENGTLLQSITRDIGVMSDDETHRTIINNASSRTHFSSGREHLNSLTSDNFSNVPKLRGAHNEIVVAVNFRDGTTLDRDALRETYGDDIQAFNVDAWAFLDSSRAISVSEEEAMQKVVAMTYYNLATAHVLCGSHMEVVALR